MRCRGATVFVGCVVALLAASSAPRAAEPPNPNDPCARSGRDTCGTAGVGFYRLTRYGTRWFGDFRGAVKGHRHAFCIDLRFWYASPSYRYREVSSTVLRNRDGAIISREKQQRMAYALWAFGRSTKPRRQAATMLYVDSLMGTARPAELDPDVLPTRVGALYRSIARAAARYHGPYRVETRVPKRLIVNHPTRATVSIRSASGHALPDATLSVSARGAAVPSRARTDGRGRALITLRPTAVHVALRVAGPALASSRPRIFAPSTASAARNGQRLVVPSNEQVSARVSRLAHPAVTSLVSRQIVRAGGTIFDRIRVAGLAGSRASIEVELFGPFPSREAITCTGSPYWQRRMSATAAEIRTPPVQVTRAGFYTYRQRLVGPASVAGAQTPCGVVSETTLSTPQISTGRGDSTADAHALVRGGQIPVWLRIRELGIKAAIVPEVIDIENGVLGMPANIRRLGWWRDGMAPRAHSGSILIAGHYDFATSGRGAFYSLPHARRGERVQIATADGSVHTYRVVTVDSYPKTALPLTVFDRRGPPRLVLVTCGGRFDSTTKHFLDNIVVTAVPV
jgi:sortase family protein